MNARQPQLQDWLKSLACYADSLHTVGMPLALVCLGNPGKQYEKTRHNAGWMLCRRLFEICGEQLNWTEKFHSQFAESFSLFGEKTFIQHPQKFMNRSGIGVRELVTFYKLLSESLVVVHDDLETPFGDVTFQFGGGHGGHNGIRSIIQELGTPDFFRLKIGIGRPLGKETVSAFVLGKFSQEEEISLPRIINSAAELLDERLSTQPIDKTAIRRKQII
ncbi:MAG: aminoacyl-tRNA hydrolase [Spirochaetales bacterium]|jgi:PTH1 family peptidyl-tRNA hydrolase|nr:aminoacyl-tRNA hydrolase [Spirochaetales bacterium]